MTSDATLPPPLVPPEVDLRDFGFMPLDVRTLLSSSLWIKAKKDPRVAHAAMSLWCEAWHQVPAGSLPDDDEVLADLARCDAKEWARVKDRVLQHFVKCSDGLLYHRTVAAKAIEAWKSKLAQRDRTKAATEAREAKRRAALAPRHVERDGQRDVDRDVDRDVSRDVQRDDLREKSRDVHQGTGTVKGQGQGDLVVGAAAPPPSAAKAPPTLRGNRLPADWVLPKPWGDWALAEYPQWTPDKVRREGASFRDHWAAKTGKDATKADWEATWRNWCRSDIAHRSDPRPPSRTPGVTPSDTAARNAEARRLLGFDTAPTQLGATDA